jgi:hypothetical protein
VEAFGVVEPAKTADGGLSGQRLRGEGLLFLKKKKQKDFFTLGHGRGLRQRPWPIVMKVFWLFFSKKNHLPFSASRCAR